MPVQTPLQSKGGTEGWGGKGGEGGLGQRGLKLPTNCPYSSQRDKEHPQKELCPFPSVQPPTTPAELGCSSFAKKNPPKLWYNVWSPCAAISPRYFPLFPPAFSGQGPPFHPLPVQRRAPWGLLAAAGVSGGSPNTNNNNLQSVSPHAAALRADSGFPHPLLPIPPCNTHLAAS